MDNDGVVTDFTEASATTDSSKSAGQTGSNGTKMLR